MKKKANQPWVQTEATKVIGKYSLTDLSQCVSRTANQFWSETRAWATNMARKIATDGFRNEYWIEEFASVAIASLCLAWAKRPHLSGEEWFKFAKTVMSRQIKRVFLFELTRGKVMFTLDVKEEDKAARPSSDQLEFQRADDAQLDGGLGRVDDTYDLNVEFAGLFESLTPSERRVLPERVDNPSATSDEVAEWASFRTGGAVRFHEMNIHEKAKSFISKHPNKKEWQRYLVTDTPNEPPERSE